MRGGLEAEGRGGSVPSFPTTVEKRPLNDSAALNAETFKALTNIVGATGVNLSSGGEGLFCFEGASRFRNELFMVDFAAQNDSVFTVGKKYKGCIPPVTFLFLKLILLIV